MRVTCTYWYLCIIFSLHDLYLNSCLYLSMIAEREVKVL